MPIAGDGTWSGDRHDGDRVHVGVRQQGDQIRRARTDVAMQTPT